MKYLIVIMLAVLFSCSNDGVDEERKYFLVHSTNKADLELEINTNLDMGRKLEGGVCVYKDENGRTHYIQAMTYVPLLKSRKYD
mgnify:CR=1 FL=1